MMDKKAQYRAMALKAPLPLFYHPEWLDAVCGKDAWDLALAISERHENHWAVWPYRMERRFGQSLLLLPPLTPYLGPWVHMQNAGNSKSLISACTAQLPGAAYALASTYPGEPQEFLELFWNQWRHIGRITYTISGHISVDQAWEALDSAVRNKVRKAQKNFTLETTEDFEALWSTQAATFSAQRMKVPYTRSWLQQLFETIVSKQWGQLTLARDLQGKTAGAQLTVWDARCGYNLLLSSFPQARHDGVVQWLLWNSLEHVLKTGRHYDFEGSVLPAVAPVFSAFGAEAKQYHLLYRPGNRFWAAVWELLGKSVK